MNIMKQMSAIFAGVVGVTVFMCSMAVAGAVATTAAAPAGEAGHAETGTAPKNYQQNLKLTAPIRSWSTRRSTEVPGLFRQYFADSRRDTSRSSFQVLATKRAVDRPWPAVASDQVPVERSGWRSPIAARKSRERGQPTAPSGSGNCAPENHPRFDG